METWKTLRTWWDGLFHRAPVVPRALGRKILEVDKGRVTAEVLLDRKGGPVTVTVRFTSDTGDSWSVGSDTETTFDDWTVIMEQFDVNDLVELMVLSDARCRKQIELHQAQAALFRHGIGLYTGSETQEQVRNRTIRLKRDISMLNGKIETIKERYNGRE